MVAGWFTVAVTDPVADALAVPATAQLRLTLQQGMVGRTKRGPWVRIDDVPVPTTPGVNVLPVTAGRHTVSIVSAAQIGATTVAEFDVAVGGTAELWYAAPFARYSAGRIGPEPQPDESRRFLGLVGVIMAAGVIYEAVRR